MKIDCKITTIKDKNKIIHLIYITPAPHYAAPPRALFPVSSFLLPVFSQLQRDIPVAQEPDWYWIEADFNLSETGSAAGCLRRSGQPLELSEYKEPTCDVMHPQVKLSLLKRNQTK